MEDQVITLTVLTLYVLVLIVPIAKVLRRVGFTCINSANMNNIGGVESIERNRRLIGISDRPKTAIASPAQR
jgi:hypothetical protein